MNTMRFRLIQSLSRSNNPTFSFVVLLLCLRVFVCVLFVPRYIADCYFYSQENRLIDMTCFRLLQSQQIHIWLGLYLQVTSSLVGCRSYWAPGPDEYLWYRQYVSHHVLMIFTGGHPLLKFKTIHHFTVLVGQTQTETKNYFQLLFWFVFSPTSSIESTKWIIFPCFLAVSKTSW
jgi:hypothetical protein